MINFLEPNQLPSSLYIISLCVRVYWLLLLEQNKCYMYLFYFRSHNIVDGMIFIWCKFERSSWLNCVYNLTIDIVLISDRSERQKQKTQYQIKNVIQLARQPNKVGHRIVILVDVQIESSSYESDNFNSEPSL